MQGTGYDRQGTPIRYGRDVGALITIDTPNQGSGLAYVSGFPERDECILADTARASTGVALLEAVEPPAVARPGAGALDHLEYLRHRSR